jgi:light-regulated signal transduction histidine kinase (bacteriophytochrome)
VDARPPDQLTGELEAFAAAVAHELRTPLSALSGEVELALRRERSPAAYRDALSRIATSIAELVDLTGDLTLLGQTPDAQDLVGRIARLDTVMADVAARYRATPNDVLVVETALTGVAVAVSGDEALLIRALTLVLDHAVRHRREGARVRLRTAPAGDLNVTSGPVDLVVDAAPAGFLPHAWQFLIAAAGGAEPTRRPLTGPLRLRTAERIVRDCGGSLHVATIDGVHAVEIRLHCPEVV